MSLLAQYNIPGAFVRDYSVEVPLCWHGHRPGEDRFDGDTIAVFYRVLSDPGKQHDQLPFLIYLQGGPGGAGPRPEQTLSGWIAQALKRYHVVLLDQRGTGRSTPVTASMFSRISSVQDQARYLKAMLASSIINDAEHIRLTQFEGTQWITLGQSYGGFLTLSYLSLYPQAIKASFITGGVGPVGLHADEVYERTFPRMLQKSKRFYDLYPVDVHRVAALADAVEDGTCRTPAGEVLTAAWLQTLGSCLGMKYSAEKLHWLFDIAFDERDGSKALSDAHINDEFIAAVAAHTATSPLYWTLQEFIYANGQLSRPINWAASQQYQSRPEFASNHRPLMFTGEAIFPWMFEQHKALQPFGQAVHALMQETDFDVIYDEDQLQRNEVPLFAAVYDDDMYVDSTVQKQVLDRIPHAHRWVTNEFEHDGLRTGNVFGKLLDLSHEYGQL